jgi:uncharacterized membrane-anchored protein YhcB (DUF1043 family)
MNIFLFQAEDSIDKHQKKENHQIDNYYTTYKEQKDKNKNGMIVITLICGLLLIFILAITLQPPKTPEEKAAEEKKNKEELEEYRKEVKDNIEEKSTFINTLIAEHLDNQTKIQEATSMLKIEITKKILNKLQKIIKNLQNIEKKIKTLLEQIKDDNKDKKQIETINKTLKDYENHYQNLNIKIKKEYHKIHENFQKKGVQIKVFSIINNKENIQIEVELNKSANNSSLEIEI